MSYTITTSEQFSSSSSLTPTFFLYDYSITPQLFYLIFFFVIVTSTIIVFWCSLRSTRITENIPSFTSSKNEYILHTFNEPKNYDTEEV